MRNRGAASGTLPSILDSIGGPSVLIAMLVLGTVALIIIPLPPIALDILLVINLVVSLVLLMRALLLQEPVQLYSFPTMLLLATLFRLALNVSSTRLILMRGENGTDAAGQVIGSFGDFVVQGNFFVGVIVFGVIAVVNFLVIARGSARVAEVAARFVLDALPGKQLAIDADLRSGTIDSEEAELRRNAIARESKFFGAMDGAMKFVQGDAIAGLVIVVINAVGGVFLGVSRGSTVDEAIRTFGVLTIGDGLVNIIPSLLLSLCAGIIVTHVSSDQRSGSAGEILGQFLGDRRALILSGLTLLIIGLVPAFPMAPFVTVAVLLLGIGIFAGGVEYAAVAAPTRSGAFAQPQSSLQLAGWGEQSDGGSVALLEQRRSPELVEGILLEVDSGVLGPYIQQEQVSEDFVTTFDRLREDIYRRLGMEIPACSVLPKAGLEGGGYRLLVRDQLVRSGRLPIKRVCAVGGPSLLALFGVRNGTLARHPVDGRSAFWIDSDPASIQALRHLNVEILLPPAFLAAEIAGGALEVAEELFGLNEVKERLQQLREQHRFLVEEVFERSLISYAEFTEVLRRLLRERVNIRDLKLILEGVAEFGSLQTEPRDRQEWLSELHSFLRIVLSRSIVGSMAGDRSLRVFLVSQEIEEELRSAMSMWDQGRTRLPLEPQFEQQLRDNARRMFAPVLERGVVPVVMLCSGDVRPAVQEFFGRQLASSDWFRTVAFEELDGGRQPEAIGVLSVAS